MFDVLVYLYEHYWRADACPAPAQLSRKLSAVGFESEEIADALAWLDGLTHSDSGFVGEQTPLAQRLYTPAEFEKLGSESIAFISFLETADVLPAPMREMVLDRAMAVPDSPVDLDALKIIVLMVFWSRGEEPDALVLDELFVAEDERLYH